jgi:hypothetical protein
VALPITLNKKFLIPVKTFNFAENKNTLKSIIHLFINQNKQSMKQTNQWMRAAGRFALLITAAIFITSLATAQVTTSGMNGKVTGSNGESLPGATIIAVHTPSGSQYGTTTDINGLYRIVNMRIGGPYTVTVTYVGYQPTVADDIYLNLGQTYGYNIKLSESASQITGVEIVSSRNELIDGNRTGASTNISTDQITAMPTISRSINDYTRLTPQTGSGNSFAGRDGRYNNITIDGANFNNNFGLSSKNLPGGDAQPISLDAIEEISVNIAPYDIRQSNFTGANINAVTRSGNNTYTGSAYVFYRDKAFNGVNVDDVELTLDKTQTTTYGARFGGPIIKDKLFFFANAEWENSSFPGIPWRASDPENGVNPDANNYISRTTVGDMETMRNYLMETYGYDPGSYSNFGNFESKNYKLLGRLDYNLHKNHKLTVRYNYVESNNDQQVNATSAPRPRSNQGRIGATSMSFDKANYGFQNTVGSITGEVNSIFGKQVSNKFLVTYTKIVDTRTSDSDIFPFVDIYKDGDPYMSFGYELFTFDNEVKNNNFSITDNVSYFIGKHTLTAGVSFEHMYFGNSYKRYGTSYYRYASMNDFMTNGTPTAYGITYPYEGAGDGYAELNFGWGSVYLQDEFQIADNFKLTGGIRLEMPFYNADDLLPNPSITELTFKDLDGNDIKLDAGTWPDATPVVSPRLGFNWDVMNDRKIQVRGGTGLFTGRLPFVWFTNQPTNSGTLQNTEEVTNPDQLVNLPFNPDPFAHVNQFPSKPGNTPPGNLAVVDKDFVMPQIWRSNLAADFKLPFYDLVFTLEYLYSKDVNAIIQYNANQRMPSGTFAGADNRNFFDTAYINKGIQSAMVLTNASEGYSHSFTAMINKPMTQGLFGMFAYTYNLTKDLTANPGSAANSAWQSNPSINDQNNLELSYSQFAVPHRLVGALSYNFGNNFILDGALRHTTISLFYSGSNQGRLTYVYSNDMNGDQNSADIMYIPANDDEIIFKDITSGGDVIFTAAQQREAFWNYVNQDDYLKEHKGEYAERYGVLMPWYHRFDFRLLQDLVSHDYRGHKHTLQFSLDILNIGNLLNSSWGVLKTQTLGRYDITLLRYTGKNAEGVPTYQLNRVNNELPTQTYNNVLSTASTWGAQVGLRYSF